MRSLTVVVFFALSVFAEVTGHAGEAQNKLFLSDAIEEALKNNPEIQTVKNKIQAHHARSHQATYLEDPEVNFEAWGIPLNQPVKFRSANPLIFGVRQKIPFFGKRDLIGEIVASDVQMAETELTAKENEIVAKVKNAYAEYFMAGKNLEITRANLELIRQLNLTAENLYKVGKAPQQDVIKALLEQTDLLNRVNSGEREVTISQARLNTLLSRHPGSPLGLPDQPKSAPLSVEIDALEKLAFKQKPELRGLEANIKRSEKAVELAQRNQKYPDFMLGLQYWLAPDQKQKNMYTPMVSLTIPFSPWTKGKHDYEVEEALAEQQAAKSQLDATKNAAILEVREMFVRARAATKSVAFYQDGLLPQAEQSFGAAVTAYQTGQVNFSTLLEAQRTIREVRLGYYKALVEYEQSVVDLEKAVGVTFVPRVKN